MIVIAHRGNLNGPNPLSENSPESIQDCLAFGFHVEIDIWMHEKSLWLGHDEPVYKISDTSKLQFDRLWCHAKNLEAAQALRDLGAHYFWHENDSFALTSRGYFWTYPGKILCENSIAVMPELDFHKETFPIAAGVCTDWPLRYIAQTT